MYLYVYLCAYMYNPKYNLLSLYHVSCLHIFRTGMDLQNTPALKSQEYCRRGAEHCKGQRSRDFAVRLCQKPHPKSHQNDCEPNMNPQTRQSSEPSTLHKVLQSMQECWKTQSSPGKRTAASYPIPTAQPGRLLCYAGYFLPLKISSSSPALPRLLFLFLSNAERITTFYLFNVPHM